MPIKRRGDNCSSWERKPKCGFTTLSPRYGRGCARCRWGKAPYSNFGAGVDISSLVAVQQVKFCKKPLTETGEAVFLGFKTPAPHVAGVAALVKAEVLQSQMKFSVS